MTTDETYYERGINLRHGYLKAARMGTPSLIPEKDRYFGQFPKPMVHFSSRHFACEAARMRRFSLIL
jgi:hypothetical protein